MCMEDQEEPKRDFLTPPPPPPREGLGPSEKFRTSLSRSRHDVEAPKGAKTNFDPKMAGLACNKLSVESDELPRCSTLFLTEDGSQMNFYMTPCAMKTRLRPLIHVSLRLTCNKFYIALSSVYIFIQ